MPLADPDRAAPSPEDDDSLASPRHEPHEGNQILRFLPPALLEKVRTVSEVVSLRRGTTVETAGEAPPFIHFPLNALLSRTVLFEDGRMAGAAILGSREAAGLEVLTTGTAGATTATVMLAGTALRSPLGPLRGLFTASPELRHAVMTALQALAVQLSFNAACHRFHTLEQRYGRWLLETSDRIGSDDLQLTHEVAANLLGVRRAGLTGAANVFERRMMIVKKRGMTTISDRAALESTCCGCYANVRREYDRLLGNGKAPRETMSM